ncbi:hypothetical protein V6N13_134629 [Hibiscus sabdariffa]
MVTLRSPADSSRRVKTDDADTNKFAAFGDGSGNVGLDVVVVDDSRKCRAAAGGVAELMQQLKPKKKVPKKRGLNDPIKHSRVLKVARQYDVEILCLSETRVWEHNASGIWSGKFRDWTVLHNYSHA